jgi:RNA polymerase sigma factor (sigma-70 family)
MNTQSDNDLLSEYARTHSEAAFALLVQRHLNLVYSVALRRTRDVELARDCCQLVFVDLAKKAGRLRANTVLAAWLHRASYFAANRLLRSEIRRIRREKAVAMREFPQDSDAGWDDIVPLLDKAIQKLADADRQAVILRFLENKSHQEVASALGISEDAARKRVDRAIERLRIWLGRRGVQTSAAGFTALVSAQAIHAVPAGLEPLLISAAASSAPSVSLFTQFFNAMTATQLKTGLAALAVAGMTIPIAIQQRTISDLKAENILLQSSPPPPSVLEPAPPDYGGLAAVRDAEDEVAELRLDRSELMRLRGQVGLLHSQLAEAQDARAQLAEELARAKDKLTNSLITSWTLKRQDWQNRSFSQPLDAFETMLWAWTTGDEAVLDEAVHFPEGMDAPAERERFLRSILPREQPSVTRTDRINVFWHSGDKEQTERRIVALERFTFVARPIEYRERLVTWDLRNVAGEWRIVGKRYLD